MSTVNSFDKNLHFSELNSPLFTGNPVPTTPAARKAASRSNLGAAGSNGDTGIRFGSQPLVNQTPQAINASATATAAQVVAGWITSTTAAAVAITLPTGALLETALIAAYPNLQNNDILPLKISNLGNAGFAITFVAGASFTIGSGASPSIAANSGATLYVRRVSAGVYTLNP